MTEQLKTTDMQLVNGEALQAFAVGSTKEVTALLGLVEFTHKAILDHAEAKQVDFEKAMSEMAESCLAEIESTKEEIPAAEYPFLVARVKRGFTLLSFLTKTAIPAHMVLIDHITTRAAEAALVTQKAVKEEEVAKLETPTQDTTDSTAVH